jgi:hypothetical protein
VELELELAGLLATIERELHRAGRALELWLEALEELRA